MKEVEAVKDINVLNSIPVLLKKHHGEQYALIWSLGINVALRISDLLSIKMSNIADGRVQLIESKTGKVANIALNEKAQAIINQIQDTYPDATYLFQSRSSRNLKGAIKPISRQAVSDAFKSTGEMVGVQLGTHSMRKTRGYHLYQQTKDISRVMAMLRQSSERVTMRYIGITQDDIDSDFNALVL